jgi:hypothetical protein
VSVSPPEDLIRWYRSQPADHVEDSPGRWSKERVRSGTRVVHRVTVLPADDPAAAGPGAVGTNPRPRLGRLSRLRPWRHLPVEEADVTAVSGARQRHFIETIVVLARSAHDRDQVDEPALSVPIPQRFDGDDWCGDGRRLLEQFRGPRLR